MKSADYIMQVLTNHSQGYTVHVPPLLLGCAFEFRVAYEQYILGNHSLSMDYRATYVYEVGNRFISRETPRPQYIDMGINHEGTTNLPKMAETGSCYCFVSASR